MKWDDTFTAGIPNLSILCVFQNPTPAVNDMASSGLRPSMISSMLAFAKSEGAMVEVVRL